MPNIPTIPDNTGGAGNGNLNSENITPTRMPVKSDSVISIILFLLI